MTDDKRVLSLVPPGGATDKLQADVDEFRRKMPTIIEHRKLLAKIQFEAYHAYLDAGFSAKQAMELVKAMQ